MKIQGVRLPVDAHDYLGTYYKSELELKSNSSEILLVYCNCICDSAKFRSSSTSAQVCFYNTTPGRKNLLVRLKPLLHELLNSCYYLEVCGYSILERPDLQQCARSGLLGLNPTQETDLSHFFESDTGV